MKRKRAPPESSIFTTNQIGAEMISNDDIRTICDRGSDKGYDIKVRDIAFVLLCKHFEDPNVAYRSVFGTAADAKEMEDYISSSQTADLREMLRDYTKTITTLEKAEMDITFEENKEALVSMLERINKAVSDGELDIKDALRMEKDIRVALNDKFSVDDESRQQQFVIVEPKFNHICEWTRKECFLQTKEYAKKHWRLYEKDELMAEIRKNYKLERKQNDLQGAD